MKTIKKVPYELGVLPDTLPEAKDMVPGKFYFSEKFQASSHLCPCGCGDNVFLPIGKDDWELERHGTTFSISPSILKRLGCKSHYVIKKGVASILEK